MKRHLITIGLATFVSHASAQVDAQCPTSEVCFKLNIPQDTASSGNGDIFFQISAPSSYEWASLGQGSGMVGANIFVIYTSADGKNVTLSPRLATSKSSVPAFNGDAEVTLLEGSGVSDGKMVANVRCANCQSWSSGTADFTSGKGNWIYAYQESGGPKNSDDPKARFDQHDKEGRFEWEYANAKGGDSVNPLLSAATTKTANGGTTVTSCVPRPVGGTSSGAAATATSTKTNDDDDNDRRSRWMDSSQFPSWPVRTAYPTAAPRGPPREKRQEINYCDDDSSSVFTPIDLSKAMATQRKMLIAHGTLAALAFVILFPAGAIAIRLASFRGVVWLHAAFQVFAYLVYVAAFGLGVHIANEMDLLNDAHPIIGICVFVVLCLMPILGLLHHAVFKKTGTRSFWSYAHLWLGRAAVTLGIINGGLGFRLAETTRMGSKSSMVAYSVIAGVVWLVWVAASVLGERRRRGRAPPPKYTEHSRDNSDTTALQDLRPEHGHYAPK